MRDVAIFVDINAHKIPLVTT